MNWPQPDFEEINLSGEVTAYANTDESVRTSEQLVAQAKLVTASADSLKESTA